MTSDFDPTADLAHFDLVQAVTLRRRSSAETLAIATAWRSRSQLSEAEPSGGAAAQCDADWHLQLGEADTPPRLGDVVVDAQGNRWTVLEVEQLAALGRYKCATRELRIAYGCCERVDLMRAVWEDSEIVDWAYVMTALPVRIQPDEAVVDTSTDPPTTEFRYRIIFGEMFDLVTDDRFMAEDGTIYELRSYKQAERIDALGVAEVVRIEA